LLAEGTRTVIGIKAKKCQGRFFVDKVPVLDMLGRGGRVIYTVVRNTSYITNNLSPQYLEVKKEMLYSI
jgi:hypothetical protein